MVESDTIVLLILSFSALLIIISAIHRYARHFIIPGVTFMMFLGAISALLPAAVGTDFEDIYDILEERLSDLILLVIIPILIFESGRKLRLGEIKKEALPIGFFAIIGVIITIFIIGLGINISFDIPFIHALLFGTILAATDPVAVGAIFKKFPIPHRLNLILEGESLFNDATGVISFNVVSAIVFSGVIFSLAETSVFFLWSMLGAIGLGIVIGWLGGIILNKWNADEHVDFTFSIALAIGGYVVGEHFLHVSGVVTTLFTAMLLLVKHKEIIRETRTLFNKYWDYTGFITNSFLFFLIGIPLLNLEPSLFSTYGLLIFIAPFIIMMASRAIVVCGGSKLLSLFRVTIPLKWRNILTLGGLRGGISVALVLSIPLGYEFKELFVAMIIPLIAINLILNPVLLNRYLSKSKSI